MRFFQLSDSSRVEKTVVSALAFMLDGINGHVHLFRSVRDLCNQPNKTEFGIKLYSRSVDRRYVLLVIESLGAIVSGGTLGSRDFDMVIRSKHIRP